MVEIFFFFIIIERNLLFIFFPRKESLPHACYLCAVCFFINMLLNWEAEEEKEGEDLLHDRLLFSSFHLNLSCLFSSSIFVNLYYSSHFFSFFFMFISLFSSFILISYLLLVLLSRLSIPFLLRFLLWFKFYLLLLLLLLLLYLFCISMHSNKSCSGKLSHDFSLKESSSCCSSFFPFSLLFSLSLFFS